MENIRELVVGMVSEIVDDVDGIRVELTETTRGNLLEVKVSRGDVGKVIGKSGRVASAIRTIAKAAGAKQGQRIMVNVFNKPLE